MRIEQEPPREGEEEDEELVGAPEEGGLDGAIGAVAPDGTWRDGVTTQVPERFAREPAADEAGDAGAAPGAPETWEHEVKRLGFAMMATLVVWVIAPWLLYLAWGMLTREPEPGAKPRGVGLALLAMVQGLGQSIAVAIWLATYVRLVLR
ncbi:MAG: hypothetical protein HYZ53_13785 [Planctomycetes bacterium]|nr:hypothetical protein [Planctomycetota bacterium]